MSDEVPAELQDHVNNELPDLPTDCDIEDQPMDLTTHLSKEYEQPDFSQNLLNGHEHSNFPTDADCDGQHTELPTSLNKECCQTIYSIGNTEHGETASLSQFDYQSDETDVFPVMKRRSGRLKDSDSQPTTSMSHNDDLSKVLT